MSIVTLYHGSKNPDGIDKIRIDLANDPFCRGRKTLDFGQGFYLTPRSLQAIEWSIRHGKNGSLNFFTLDVKNLKILNLDPKSSSPLYWIGEIIYNRKFYDVPMRLYSYVIKNWKINTDDYDVILGYTADDQYFTILRDFINNKLSFQGLCKVLMLGDLGYQYVIRSKKAYNNVRKVKKSEVILCADFDGLAKHRSNTARCNYTLIREEYQNSNELFFTEIIKKDISPDDKLLSFPLY